jgi:hypothetical protein
VIISCYTPDVFGLLVLKYNAIEGPAARPK